MLFRTDAIFSVLESSETFLLHFQINERSITTLALPKSKVLTGLEDLQKSVRSITDAGLSEVDKLNRLKTAASSYTKFLGIDEILRNIVLELKPRKKNFHTIAMNGSFQNFALEFCVLPDSDALVASKYHVIRVPNREAREPTSIKFDVLYCPKVVHGGNESQFLEAFSSLAVSVAKGTRKLFNEVCSKRQGMLVVAHGHQPTSRSQMCIEFRPDEDSCHRITVDDLGTPPIVLLLCSCYTGIADTSIGLSLGQNRSHADTAVQNGAQHVVAGLIDLIQEPAIDFVHEVMSISANHGFPDAVFKAREQFFASKKAVDPERLLTVIGIGYFSDLMGVTVIGDVKDIVAENASEQISVV